MLCDSCNGVVVERPCMTVRSDCPTSHFHIPIPAHLSNTMADPFTQNSVPFQQTGKAPLMYYRDYRPESVWLLFGQVLGPDGNSTLFAIYHGDISPNNIVVM